MPFELELGRMQMYLLQKWNAFGNFEWQLSLYSTCNLLSYLSLIFTLMIHIQHIGTLNSSPKCMSKVLSETLALQNNQEKDFNQTHLLQNGFDLIVFRVIDRQSYTPFTIQRSIYSTQEGDIFRESSQFTQQEVTPVLKNLRESREVTNNNRLYPRSKLDSNQTANFSSKILAQELEGYNFISSMNKPDILHTLQAVQAAHNSRVFIETDKSLLSEETKVDKFTHDMRLMLDAGVNYFFDTWPVSQLLIKPLKERIYFFSTNKTLTDMNIENLAKESLDKSVLYIQTDTLHRCMPQEWYVGFDQFVVYSFLALLNEDLFKVGGFLSSLASDQSKDLRVDFRKDFNHLSRSSDWFSLLLTKLSNMGASLWDIAICCLVILATDVQFKSVLRQIVVVPDQHQTNLKLRRSWSISAVFFLAYWICLVSLLKSFSQRFDDPQTTSFLLANAQLFYTVSEVVFHRSEQKSIFQSYLLASSLILYCYTQTYPHSNLVPVKVAFMLKISSVFLSSLSTISITFENFKFTISQGWAPQISQCFIQLIITRKEKKLTMKLNRKLMTQLDIIKQDMANDPSIQLPQFVRVTGEQTGRLVRNCVQLGRRRFVLHCQQNGQFSNDLDRVKVAVILKYVAQCKDLYRDQLLI